ncbi:MAG: DedA family protein [Patescibacteria group bacterium]
MSEPSFIANAFASYGLVGVWFIVAFEAFEFVGSLPIGPFIVFLGGLASQGSISVVALWLTVYTAVVFGDNMGFLVGRKFGRPILYKFGTKLLKQSSIDKAERFFLRYGAVAVFFTRFIFATIAAPLNVLVGASDLKWKKFFIAGALGQAGWASIYVFLGYYFGKQIGGYVAFINEADVVSLLIITVVAMLGFAWFATRAIHHHVRVHRKYRKNQ